MLFDEGLEGFFYLGGTAFQFCDGVAQASAIFSKMVDIFSSMSSIKNGGFVVLRRGIAFLLFSPCVRFLPANPL